LTAKAKGKKIMANENSDIVAAFMADIEGKIAALQAVLLSLKSASALGALGTAIEGLGLGSSVGSAIQSSDLGQPIDLPDGAFFGKSVPACIKLFLSAARKKKTSKEITAALRDGGVESTGNFESVVSTALNRLRAGGEVLKFKDGWGLSEWYPANMRTNGIAGKTSPKKKKKGKKKNSKAASTAATPPTKAEAKKVTEIRKPEDAPVDKPELRILAFFKANPREIATSEIATALGIKIQIANLILAKLAHQEKIQKVSKGQFKALGAAS
jgi:hypothetical protein